MHPALEATIRQHIGAADPVAESGYGGRDLAEAVPSAKSGDDPVMLAALGTMAYVASMMTHEALGHGLACVAAGGHNLMLTGWGEECTLHPLPLVITAAGPAVQCVAGLLAWLVLRLLTPASPVATRSFLWLYMVFDLFISSGYVAFSGVTAFGDAADMIVRLSPSWLWRTLLVVVGAVGYYLSVWVAVRELGRILGTGGDQRLRRFLWVPYLAAGLLACCAGALNRTMAPGVGLGLVAAIVVGTGFVLVLGPGIGARPR